MSGFVNRVPDRYREQLQGIYSEVVLNCPEENEQSLIQNSFERLFLVVHVDLQTYFKKFLENSLHCNLPTKNLHKVELCRAQAKMAGYIDTGLRVMAGVMLAATGIFRFMPEAAHDFFPWLAE